MVFQAIGQVVSNGDLNQFSSSLYSLIQSDFTWPLLLLPLFHLSHRHYPLLSEYVLISLVSNLDGLGGKRHTF